MKIRSLASLAIACFALLMPRLVTSEGAFGGAIATAKPACDSKNINHACSGQPNCVAIPTTETTNNNAERYYVVLDPIVRVWPASRTAVATARSLPNFRIGKSQIKCSPFSLL